MSNENGAKEAPVNASLPLPPEITGYVGPPARAKENTAENVPCLRGFGGHCRYYWRMEQHMLTGNTEHTFKEVFHRCLKGKENGGDMELSGDVPIYRCTQWDPGDPLEANDLKFRRNTYKEQFPEHFPEDMDAGNQGDESPDVDK